MNIDLGELWVKVRNGEVLFEGPVLKKSEILGRWNLRYIKVILLKRSVNLDRLICLYWTDVDAALAHPNEPRGIFGGDHVMMDNDPEHFELEIRHTRDFMRFSDCFGSRLDIVVILRVFNMEQYDALCCALGGEVVAHVPFSVSMSTPYMTERKADAVKNDSGSAVNTGFACMQGSSSTIDGNKSLSSSKKLDTEYELLGELGKGAFSVVYRARRKIDNGNEVAVKVIKFGKMCSRERKTQLRFLNHEVKIMQKLTNQMADKRNIVQLLDCFAETAVSYRVSLVLELCTGGELFDRIVQRSSYSERDAKQVVGTLANVLRAMHAVGVVHRDLKPENLIYDTPAENATIKITDFGLALDTDNIENDVYKSHVVGTCGYFAPEVLSLRYSPACDIWSLGVITYILLCGYPPFSGRTRVEIQNEIRAGRFEFHLPEWANISKEAQNLITKMLQIRPRRRLTPDQVLQHPWIADTEAAGEQLSLTKHKQWNRKRKLRAAATAVIWASRLSHIRKDQMQKLASAANFESKDLELIRDSFNRHASEDSEANVGAAALVECNKRRSVTSPKQLLGVLTDLGYKGLNVQRMFELFDENNDGAVDEREFLTGLATLQMPGEASIKFAFSLYDKDGSGFVDRDEFFAIMSHAEKFDADNMELDDVSILLSDVFDEIDTDGDNTISFDEFKTACKRRPELQEVLLSNKLPMSPRQDNPT